MNISQALDRIRLLRNKADEIQKAIDRINSSASTVEAAVHVEGISTLYGMAVTRDGCIEILSITKQKHEDEISKLRPVVDMANAALKGILS